MPAHHGTTCTYLCDCKVVVQPSQNIPKPFDLIPLLCNVLFSIFGDFLRECKCHPCLWRAQPAKLKPSDVCAHSLYSSNYQWPSDSHLGLFALILHTELDGGGDPDGASTVEDPWREYNTVNISESANPTHQLDTPWCSLEKASLGFV